MAQLAQMDEQRAVHQLWCQIGCALPESASRAAPVTMTSWTGRARIRAMTTHPAHHLPPESARSDVPEAVRKPTSDLRWRCLRGSGHAGVQTPGGLQGLRNGGRRHVLPGMLRVRIRQLCGASPQELLKIILGQTTPGQLADRPAARLVQQQRLQLPMALTIR